MGNVSSVSVMLSRRCARRIARYASFAAMVCSRVSTSSCSRKALILDELEWTGPVFKTSGLLSEGTKEVVYYLMDQIELIKFVEY
jgi:hypothetical protein